ncbi:MAG: hypothetical protein EOM67_02870 [Spirochaetia bacterium]|nr:hypothetical protein [Spirochaetia bacterium]
MKRNYYMLISITLMALLALPLFSATFEEVDAKTSGKDKIEFPKDALSKGSTIFALVLSNTREGGEEQQKLLLDWHTSLTGHPSFPKEVSIYHFPVIENPPGFVKGFIRKGLGETYEGVVEDDKVAVLFVKDAPKFATSAGIPFDDTATVVVVDNKGNVKGFAKGEVSSDKIRTILALL